SRFLLALPVSVTLVSMVNPLGGISTFFESLMLVTVGATEAMMVKLRTADAAPGPYNAFTFTAWAATLKPVSCNDHRPLVSAVAVPLTVDPSRICTSRPILAAPLR
nr:hypothetical protein [Tanacetum cinerariifolium]